MIKYITVLDPNGGEYGTDRAPVTVNHRMIVDRNQLVGYSSIQRLFSSTQEFNRFAEQVSAQPMGSTGLHQQLHWSVDKD